MTPEEIDHVVTSWTAIGARRRQLVEQVAAHLPPSDGWAPTDRAEWVVDTVERCHGHLGRPGELNDELATQASVRPASARTAASLLEEGEALLLALHLLGRLTPPARTAWRRAWQLLSELLAWAALAPFDDAGAPIRRDADAPPPPHQSTEGPGTGGERGRPAPPDGSAPPA